MEPSLIGAKGIRPEPCPSQSDLHGDLTLRGVRGAPEVPRRVRKPWATGSCTWILSGEAIQGDQQDQTMPVQETIIVHGFQSVTSVQYFFYCCCNHYFYKNKVQIQTELFKRIYALC